jgi:hypothetical protein
MNNAPRAVDFVVGGWQPDWIADFETGQFFSPGYSGSDPSGTNNNIGLPRPER